MRKLGAVVLAATLLVAAPSLAATSGSDEGTLERAEPTSRSSAEAISQAVAAGDPSAELAARLDWADAQIGLGDYLEARRNLRAALAIAERENEPAQLIRVLLALARVHAAIGEAESAEAVIDRALELATEIGRRDLAARAHNDRGNQLARAGRSEAALDSYAKSAEVAAEVENPLLEVRAFTNAARAAQQGGQTQRAIEFSSRAGAKIGELPPSTDRTALRISLGRTEERLGRVPQAAAHFEAARATAEHLGDSRTASYAVGYLGGLYEKRKRYDEAIALTQQALAHAEALAAPEIEQLWSWQTGRIERARGNRPAAIDAYRETIGHLQAVRTRLGVTAEFAGRSFRESSGAAYFELVDLLLTEVAESGDPARATELLREARGTVELLKAAELRDYFRDECVDEFQRRRLDVGQASEDAIIVYPILLPDRIEILLDIPGTGLTRTAAPVDFETVVPEIRRFRILLEKRFTREFMQSAQQLHAWLMAPAEAAIGPPEGRTLVFVLDGPLRTIPISALHDGEQFVIEKYPVAVTPSVELTESRKIEPEKIRSLALGLSKSVQGFAALPAVAREVEGVRDLYGGGVLLDEDFQLDATREKLREAGINLLHIATHAEFKEKADESFLLAYDGRITMDKLEEYVGLFRFRDVPLELLTLSACETAQGDDQAALGLTGIAIKAGARSAVGTLWAVQDVQTERLVLDFYRRLLVPGTSRAAALRGAQRAFLADPTTRHPNYWAAFVLIGSWI